MSPDLTHAYRRYFPLLVRKCGRMLRDPHEAQDVAQESFLRLCGAGLDLGDERSVTAWLYRTSTRMAIDRLRARARRGTTPELVEIFAQEPSPEQRVLWSALWAELIRRMPEDELEAGMLSLVDGLKQREIAEVLGIHERSVRRLLAKFEERAARLRERSER